jgi:hypothetical protein
LYHAGGSAIRGPPPHLAITAGLIVMLLGYFIFWGWK